MNPTESREAVIRSFARWAAASATRQGCPMRGRELYPYLGAVPLDTVLKGNEPISEAEFSAWHRRAVEELAVTSSIGIGWAAKLVNLLLKVRAYIGSEGRPGLREHLHPPIDNLLIQVIRNKYPLMGIEGVRNGSLRAKVDRGAPIIGIRSYDTYLLVIEGFREVAQRENCGLCEIERLWPG